MVFPVDYATARAEFLQRAAGAGAQLSCLPLVARGPDDLPLTIDIAWLGAHPARKLLIHSSGLHGIEGFAGSAVQLRLLRQPPVIAADCALLLVHCLNPFGMAWLRRANENNVDLNRNFIFGVQPRAGAERAYGRLDRFLNPTYPPRHDFFLLKALGLLVRYGYGELMSTIAAGQYAFPKGLFYGGAQLEQGPLLYHDWLQQNLGQAQRVLVIDLHTGLGSAGQESLFHSLASCTAEQLSTQLQTTVETEQEAEALSYQTVGSHEQLYRELFPECRVDLITHEFGTSPALQVLYALRTENQWHHFGASGVDHPAKRRLFEAFCPADEKWRARIVARGGRLAEKGLAMLASEA